MNLSNLHFNRSELTGEEMNPNTTAAEIYLHIVGVNNTVENKPIGSILGKGPLVESILINKQYTYKFHKV